MKMYGQNGLVKILLQISDHRIRYDVDGRITLNLYSYIGLVCQ
jgi:hypothetical protein